MRYPTSNQKISHLRDQKPKTKSAITDTPQNKNISLEMHEKREPEERSAEQKSGAEITETRKVLRSSNKTLWFQNCLIKNPKRELQ